MALESQSSLWPAAAPEDEEVLAADAEDVEDPVVELPEELPVVDEPVAEAVEDPDTAVAPLLNEVGVDAALQVPAVF